jgi:hypothetical protein
MGTSFDLRRHEVATPGADNSWLYAVNDNDFNKTYASVRNHVSALVSGGSRDFRLAFPGSYSGVASLRIDPPENPIRQSQYAKSVNFFTDQLSARTSKWWLRSRTYIDGVKELNLSAQTRAIVWDLRLCASVAGEPVGYCFKVRILQAFEPSSGTGFSSHYDSSKFFTLDGRLLGGIQESLT